jgi:glycosyltransferase involved in cell wall biosynthesis
MPLHVLHCIPSVALSDGGPSQAIRNIERALEGQQIKTTTAATDHNLSDEIQRHPLLNQLIKKSQFIYRIYFKKQIHFYKVSFPMAFWLWRSIRRFDLIHIHALFSFTSVAAALIARIKKVPYIIRPLGVLNQYGIKQRRRWIKAISFHFIEKPILMNAAAVHFTSEQEAQEAAILIAGIKSEIIPLGIDLKPFAKGIAEDFRKRYSIASNKKIILFLSRIDPKKGLDILLPAFAAIKPHHPEALLVIAGDGEKSYVENLRKITASLSIGEQILWAGFLTGQDKLDALAAAHCFILPSQSENFGIAAAEALASGLPVIIGKGVAIAKEIATHQAGFVVESHTGQDYAQAMRKALTEDLTPYQKAAVLLAQERFSIETMGASLKKMYLKILNHESP